VPGSPGPGDDQLRHPPGPVGRQPKEVLESGRVWRLVGGRQALQSVAGRRRSSAQAEQPTNGLGALRAGLLDQDHDIGGQIKQRRDIGRRRRHRHHGLRPDRRHERQRRGLLPEGSYCLGEVAQGLGGMHQPVTLHSVDQRHQLLGDQLQQGRRRRVAEAAGAGGGGGFGEVGQHHVWQRDQQRRHDLVDERADRRVLVVERGQRLEEPGNHQVMHCRTQHLRQAGQQRFERAVVGLCQIYQQGRDELRGGPSRGLG
jgi:hypothetical protein